MGWLWNESVTRFKGLAKTSRSTNYNCFWHHISSKEAKSIEQYGQRYQRWICDWTLIVFDAVFPKPDKELWKAKNNMQALVQVDTPSTSSGSNVSGLSFNNVFAKTPDDLSLEWGQILAKLRKNFTLSDLFCISNKWIWVKNNLTIATCNTRWTPKLNIEIEYPTDP